MNKTLQEWAAGNRAVSGVCLATLLAALAVTAYAAAGPPQLALPEQPTIRFVRHPDAAPPFELQDLDGKTITPSDWQGKVTLLNFWATWCGPCRAEIPYLIALQTQYLGKLQIVGLVVDSDSTEELKALVRKSGINYPVAIAPDDVRLEYGGIAALPTSFLLDQQGRVVQKHVGLRDPALYETEIRALLGLPIDAKVETFEDIGQVFLAHADRASDFPGVDMSSLTPEQKKEAVRRFNSVTCTCGCAMTLAQCRINDSGCAVSLAATAKIISSFTAGPTPTAPPSTTGTPPIAPIREQ